MKKLFLQSGKLMCGEFPEYPPKPGPMSHQEFFTEFYEDDLPKYHKAVSAAKASAVEVVNPICGAQYEFMEEGQLYDTPEGWTVKIGYQFETVCGPLGKEWNDFSEPQEANYNQHKKLGRIVRKVARLIPQEINDQERIDRCHGFTPFISPKQSGIAAIGKGWDGEKFTLLRDQETIASDRTEAGIPESVENSDRYISQTEVDPGYTEGQLREKLREANKEIARLKSVSPPPQESVINLEALKRICYHFAGIVAPGWQPNAGSAFDTEWDEWLSTGKIVDWHQHPDDSKEVVKVEDLTRKP